MRRTLLLILLALATAACEPSRFCLDCIDVDGGGGDGDGGGGGDGGGAGDGGMPNDGGIPSDACVPVGLEICNGYDDDCDGTIDDGVTEVGTACNVGLPTPCAAGTYECTASELVCGGTAVNPMAESCNNSDDDCDGTIDDGNPGGGMLCGSNVGDCLQGVANCVVGVIECQGEVGPAPEECDGRDNNCDGVTDDGNPEGGASCGVGMGICLAGTINCVGGALQCQGATPPMLESCDGLDNDCDGSTDEDFPPTSDPNNCGGCGNVCAAANAFATCTATMGGTCGIAFCFTDYWDLNMDYTDGCEHFCTFQGSEICNGEDDDCDGIVDEGLTTPAICATGGECAGTTATCTGALGWRCFYGATVSTDAFGAIIPENDCDELDNDCDGAIDDAFPFKGNACDNGLFGICRGTGNFVCNATDDGLTCNITVPGGTMSAEVCDGDDDDCDGVLDDGAPDLWVQITGAFGTKWIYQYEASRPNAGASTSGTMSHRPCSSANKIPWTNVTQPQAEAACMAIGARLCTEPEWLRACNTTAATPCTWSFDTACTTYVGSTCNGNDYDFDSVAAGNQDGLLATGALTTCDANWGATAKIYDLSGNVKEWTVESAPGVNPLRGGSFNNTPVGISCGFDFVVADDSFQFNNTGFRCCRDTAP